MPACFTEPKFIVDDTFLLDYSMFFGASLCDYYEASGDKETLKDLSACAYRQMEIAKEQFDENGSYEKRRRFLGLYRLDRGSEQAELQCRVFISTVRRKYRRSQNSSEIWKKQKN